MSDLMCLPTVCVYVCVDKQKAELTQQHTEWVRQVTQRHMQQIEDLQNEIHTHTQMMALQQVHIQTTQTDRPTDRHTRLHHLKGFITPRLSLFLYLSPPQDLKQQNRLQSLERQLDEKSSEVQELKRENEDLKERMNAVIAQKVEQDDHKHKHKRSVPKYL